MKPGLQAKTQLIDCGGEPVTVERKSCVGFVDGKPATIGTVERFCVSGNLQPMTGRDLLLVPEGDRYKEQYWFFTPFQLKIGDLVTRCAVNYEVQSVQNWISFVQARLMRVDVGPKATP